MATARASFGQVTKLPSKRYRARYAVPDVYPRRYVNAPMTFDRKRDAEDWLATERAKLVAGVTPLMLDTTLTLREFTETWMTKRRNSRGESLRPSVVRTYRQYHKLIFPTLGDKPLAKITRPMVDAWYASLDPGTPTMRARTYSHLRTVLETAVYEDLIATNPCRIRGASAARVKTKTQIATPDQVLELVDQMPDHLKLAPLLGAWCQLRSGELLELRRRDFQGATVYVSRGVTRDENNDAVIGDPKTDAGTRAISIPPHIRLAVQDHIDRFAAAGPDGLLFRTPGSANEQIVQQSFSYHFKQAVRRTSLPPTFRFHWLRHTGLTLAAQAGATIAELKARAGHATASTVLLYQHATRVRDEALAEALSERAEAGRRPLRLVAS